MPTLLSFDQAPPISAPLRFFLTAPLFSLLAGLLLLWSGPELFLSRWTPAALALTHLITAGFMLQVMLGALQQLLPVMAGAHMAHPLRVATVVHACLTLGALCLAAAFLTYQRWLFAGAVVLLASGVLSYVLAALRALHRVPANPSVRGLRLALVGLGGTVGLGLLRAAGLAWSVQWPLLNLVNVHLGWGFVAWACAILAAASFVVVPMFQQTPAYPPWMVRGFAGGALAVVVAWTLAEFSDQQGWASALSVAVVLVAAVFAWTTLRLLRQSKRARPDAVQLLWWVAMLSALLSCGLWLLAHTVPTVAQWQGWPLLLGVLVLFGVFMSVIVGMLYKIVPFLVWLHLQNLDLEGVKPPNVRKVLAEPQINHQAAAHGLSLVLLLLAVGWPVWFVYPAGLAVVVANGWLLRNLFAALAVYRSYLKVSATSKARTDSSVA